VRLLLFPLRPERRRELADYQGFLLYRDFEPQWSDCRQYFDFLQGRMQFNYAQLAATARCGSTPPASPSAWTGNRCGT